MLALRVPGGFSSEPGGGGWGQRLVDAPAFLMQIVGIRDIYPSKTNGKSKVPGEPWSIHVRKTFKLLGKSEKNMVLGKTALRIIGFWKTDFWKIHGHDHDHGWPWS